MLLAVPTLGFSSAAALLLLEGDSVLIYRETESGEGFPCIMSHSCMGEPQTWLSGVRAVFLEAEGNRLMHCVPPNVSG